MQGKNLLLGLLAVIILLGGLSIAFADCTGCGDDGHQVCPIEKKHKHVTILKEESQRKNASRMRNARQNEEKEAKEESQRQDAARKRNARQQRSAPSMLETTCTQY